MDGVPCNLCLLKDRLLLFCFRKKELKFRVGYTKAPQYLFHQKRYFTSLYTYMLRFVLVGFVKKPGWICISYRVSFKPTIKFWLMQYCQCDTLQSIC